MSEISRLKDHKIEPFLTPKIKRAVDRVMDDRESPKFLTDLMRAIWESAGKKVGKKFIVSDFPSTRKRLQEEIVGIGRMAIFKPENLTMEDLAKIFPGKIPEDWVKKGAFENEVNNSGWLWVEIKGSSPDRDMAEKEFVRKFQREGRSGQTLATYIMAGYVTFLVYGHYFDAQLSYTMLLGSRKNDSPLLVHTDFDGFVSVASMDGPDYRGGLFRGYHSPMTGARSEEPVIK